MEKKGWYAVFVKTGEEDNVKERLEYRLKDTFNLFVPKRKLMERKKGVWKENIRTLFPGYVLAKGEMDDNKYYEFKEVPGIIKMLCSDTKPLKIRNDEIEVLANLICNGETIGFSKVFIENDRVVILEGPLKSMEGLIKKIDKRKGRAKVKISFLGEGRTVDLGVSILGRT
ncbi:MAG: antiterminator LoaP [Clostridiales bacterium]